MSSVVPKIYMISVLVSCVACELPHEISLRSVRRTDSKEVFELSKAGGLPESVTETEILKSIVTAVKNCYLVAVDKTGKILGAVVAERGYFGNKKVKDCATIRHMVVHPEYRMTGIATALLRNLKFRIMNKGIHSAYLMTHEDNKNAINLYKKEGFKVFSKKKPGK